MLSPQHQLSHKQRATLVKCEQLPQKRLYRREALPLDQTKEDEKEQMTEMEGKDLWAIPLLRLSLCLPFTPPRSRDHTSFSLALHYSNPNFNCVISITHNNDTHATSNLSSALDPTLASNFRLYNVVKFACGSLQFQKCAQQCINVI